ncbi:MAG TPA: transposase [Desulfotomaculum sp.]|nr:MAG: Transposase IS200-family protein [Desulfotomaculum sp. 46_80]HAG09845.1 transposase [Desulfotomaculum sp.]HBY03880.1 transposase [Desulfotomaculum sp.]
MRQPRKRSESGVYHVVLRGINRQDIFYDDEDYQRFLETIEKMKSDDRFAVYGYCLMTNHVHLLIRENTDTISRIMSRIGTSYAWWYNGKYGRSGHVFQGRYGSECVENDDYLLTVIRYIHNNPVKAGIVQEPKEYRWSSIHAYYGAREYPQGLSEPAFALSIINQDRKRAIEAFREYMKRENQDKCLEDKIKLRKTDNEIKTEIEKLMNGELIGRLQGMEKAKRNDILRKIKAIEGVSLRQISRITGLSVDIVFNS